MSQITTLAIDLETFSTEDISKCGVYRYTESDSFEILLFGVSVDHGPVHVYDLASGDVLPDEILDALVDETVTKWAFNANFERVCISSWLRKHYPERFRSYSVPEDSVSRYLDPTSWRCSMIWSAYLGLPMSLAGVGAALGLKDQKLKEGKDLIRYFCCPCTPTKANGGRTRNLPSDAPDKWALFKFYNQRDVEVELGIKDRLAKFPVPEDVWDQYHIDQEINDRGILIDMPLVKNAIAFDARSKEAITEEMKARTGLANPNSVLQMKGWLSTHGVKTDTLGKKAVAALMKTVPDEVRGVLALRQQLAKSSVKKYQAMANAVCADGRARGMFQFYGGIRTGRWAGRLIQLQNLKRNEMSDLAEARALVREGDFDDLDMLYDDIPDTLSQLVRTAFIPKDGYLFYVADFSAIEARVLSYLAGETWRSEVFQNNGDIYCESASHMFHVPVVKHGINGHLRQKGKIAELALGYGGSVGALKAMGALDMGLEESELQPLVNSWRETNPHIVKFWWDVDAAIKETLRTHVLTEVGLIKFLYKSGCLFVHLPSGRCLCYVQPNITINEYGNESISYMGIGNTKKWERINSYGPKFVENITQAISRDVLCYAMQTLRNCFICGHIHDEMIIECTPDVSLDEICRQMGRTPAWLPGIVLRADGYVTPYYRKD